MELSFAIHFNQNLWSSIKLFKLKINDSKRVKNLFINVEFKFPATIVESPPPRDFFFFDLLFLFVAKAFFLATLAKIETALTKNK